MTGLGDRVSASGSSGDTTASSRGSLAGLLTLSRLRVVDKLLLAFGALFLLRFLPLPASSAASLMLPLGTFSSGELSPIMALSSSTLPLFGKRGAEGGDMLSVVVFMYWQRKVKTKAS